MRSYRQLPLQSNDKSPCISIEYKNKTEVMKTFFRKREDKKMGKERSSSRAVERTAHDLMALLAEQEITDVVGA